MMARCLSIWWPHGKDSRPCWPCTRLEASSSSGCPSRTRLMPRMSSTATCPFMHSFKVRISGNISSFLPTLHPRQLTCSVGCYVCTPKPQVSKVVWAHTRGHPTSWLSIRSYRTTTVDCCSVPHPPFTQPSCIDSTLRRASDGDVPRVQSNHGCTIRVFRVGSIAWWEQGLDPAYSDVPIISLLPF